MSARSYRLAGAAVCVAAVAVALTARGFTVGFITDPVGPRALPWLAAALLGIGGIGMLIDRSRPVAWPTRPMLWKLLLAVLSLLGFALLTEPLGFTVATTALAASFGVLFGARWGPALAVGVIVALALFGFFAWGLGVPLPAGRWLGGP